MQVLSRRTKNNPVLLGEPGVGKTAIVEGLAQRIHRGDVPQSLLGCRVVALDMVGGLHLRGGCPGRRPPFSAAKRPARPRGRWSRGPRCTASSRSGYVY